MRVSLKTVGLLTALVVFVAAVTLFVQQRVQTHSQAFAPAVPLQGAVIREVSGELGWQNTGILLAPGETIKFQFMAGEIQDGDIILRGPAGTGYTCGTGTCCEPIPGAQRDTLIGRVGDHLFRIGDKRAIEVQEGGELQLRINDCDDGLFDNSGSFQIKIFP